MSVKYLAVIMRADNHGEGGILSLVALVQQRFGTAEPWARRAVALGVLGAALFYCDALITPAISVLSAVEGLELLNPGFERAVIAGDARCHRGVVRDSAPRHGASGAHCSVPIMILWFVVLAVLGAMEIVQAPQVLAAVNPWYALQVVRRAPGPVAGHPRRRVPGGDGRRSAVRRHGPLRAQARRDGLADAGVARIAHQLLRSGRIADAVDGADRQSFLCAGAAGVAAGAGAVVDRRDRHRLAGDDLGRILGDARSRAARPAAARARAADLGGGAWADLRAGGEPFHVRSPWSCSWWASAARARCRPPTARRWWAPC